MRENPGHCYFTIATSLTVMYNFTKSVQIVLLQHYCQEDPLNLNTVNSEIFVQNGEITPLSTDDGKSCRSRKFLTLQLCPLTLFAKMKFLKKNLNLNTSGSLNSTTFFTSSYFNCCTFLYLIKLICYL